MKITLAFCCHNVERDIESVLRSWLDNLSGRHEVEVLAACDDCRDRTADVARQVLRQYSTVIHGVFETDNIWEIRCNNMMLQGAANDSIIIFAQGDNWLHDKNWDDVLVYFYESYSGNIAGAVGAVGLLSGVRMNRDFSYDRIECYRPHKHEGAWVHGIAKDAYPLAVYQVDFINRPFAISTQLLREYGGLDEAYCPMDWDDADLSMKLLRDGFTNLYVPFDLVNTSAKQQTLTSAQMSANYQHGEAIMRQRWSKFVAKRESSVKMLLTMTEANGRLSL